MQAKGFKEKLLLSMESTFGVTNDPPEARVMPFNPPLNLKASQSQTKSQTITGNRNPVQPSRGNVAVDGDLAVPVDVRVFPLWLMLALGLPTTTGAGPYVHVFKPRDELPSVTLEAGFSTPFDHYSKFAGCKVDGLGFSFGGDGELVAKVKIIGADEAVGTASMDAEPSSLVFTRFNNFQAAIKEGGVSVATITECSIDIANGLDGSVYCIGGGGKRGDIPEGMLAVSGKIKALFDSQVLYQKAVAGTESSLELTLTCGAHSLKIEIPELMFQRQGLTRNGAAGVFVELPFEGYYQDAAAQSAIVITVTNDVAEYA